jgi:DNA-binding transcriptional MerR regulator
VELVGLKELEKIRAAFPTGIPANAILEIFRPKGVQLSEATFRKYVQAGLLPRSKRVGRKGKHRGSQGLYPVETVRRIGVIKTMMAQGMTLEEIRQSLVFYKNHIDDAEHALDETLEGFELEIARRPFSRDRKRQLESKLAELKERARALLKDVQQLGSVVTVRQSSTDSQFVYNAGA